MCVPSLGWTLNGNPVCQHSLVHVKDPTVSFTKSRRAITSAIVKFQLPVLTRRGHCINGTATPSADDATPQPCAAHNQENDCMEKEQEGTHLHVGSVVDGVTRGAVVSVKIWQQNLGFPLVKDVRINHFKKKKKNKKIRSCAQNLTKNRSKFSVTLETLQRHPEDQN